MTRPSRVEVIANVASGSVGADAPEVAAKIFAKFGVQANIRAPAGGELERELKAAVEAKPDLIVVIAGDGTARAAAEAAGPEGPMIAPLPGGTMNMLPKAIYGQLAWPDALTAILERGEERMIGGGAVDGRTFLVAAILGAPALWAPAREAVRAGKPRLAWLRARRALGRAFTGRLRYTLGDGPREKAEALTFMCPLASRALADDEQALEAAALDVADAGQAFRLGIQALVGDWRDDPNVVVERCRLARVWASGGIPALLDGELVRLGRLAEVVWKPQVARILGLPKDDA